MPKAKSGATFSKDRMARIGFRNYAQMPAQKLDVWGARTDLQALPMTSEFVSCGKPAERKFHEDRKGPSLLRNFFVALFVISPVYCKCKIGSPKALPRKETAW